MGGKYKPCNTLNVNKQAAYMGLHYPDFKTKTAGNKVVSVGVLQPTPLSERYRVRIEYEVGHRPIVTVEHPQLAVGGERLPHTFSGNELCLHYAETGEWGGDKLLSRTIVPWASEWLLHYEIWRVTGSWRGGGVHPEDGDELEPATGDDCAKASETVPDSEP